MTGDGRSTHPTDPTDPTAVLAVLAGLPRIGSRRLRVILQHHAAHEALRRLAAGLPLHHMVERAIATDLAVVRSAAHAVGDLDRAAVALEEVCVRSDVRMLSACDADFPEPFRRDLDPPAVLFVRGDPTVLRRRRVGIVGTRNATGSGVATARDLGESLGGEGVAVISGLARGIDGAAHEGVRRVDGPAVAVVGSGPDVPYPRHHTELWAWVSETGLLISEYAPGTPPDAWRFPRRNRILAALCEVLVVVESREKGGSLLTVREALDREVEVMAVPGSPRSRASHGTNQLLVDGATPLASVDDVFAALELDHRRQRSGFDSRPRPEGDQVVVLDACRELGPATLDAIAESTGLGIPDAALAAARLERSGWLLEAGGWFEIAGSRLNQP